MGVLGSGIMGSGIAEIAAEAGYEVILRSRRQETADHMRTSVERSLLRKIEKGRLSEDAAREIMGRIQTTSDIDLLGPCNLVIESVVEDLAVKKNLFAELSIIVDESTIIATNTSTLPVVELAAVTKHPERVCGIHFFNPATVMKLVEIVTPITASEETISTAVEFAKSLHKDVVKVKDQAGRSKCCPFCNPRDRQRDWCRDGLCRLGNWESLLDRCWNEEPSRNYRNDV